MNYNFNGKRIEAFSKILAQEIPQSDFIPIHWINNYSGQRHSKRCQTMDNSGMVEV